MNIRFIYGLLLFLLANLAFGTDSEFPKSRVLLEQRAQELKEESRFKSQYRNDLVKLESDVKLALACLDTKQPPDSAAIRQGISDIDKALKSIEGANPKTIIDQGHREYDELASAFKRVRGYLNAGLDCLDSLQIGRTQIDALLSDENFEFSPKSRQSKDVAEIVNRYMSSVIKEIRSKGPGKLRQFLIEYINEGRAREIIPPSTLSALKTEVSAIMNFIETNNQTLVQLKNATQNLLKGIQEEKKSADAKINDIDNLLSKLDDRLSSGAAATDKQLIIAVYMMICALVFLFLGMKFIKDPLAEKIIENRSLVEVISMAFLLLTIIILGTGEKMPKEAIGTLLGSIAGYIFGRKMTENK
jgi:hypothetical protein